MTPRIESSLVRILPTVSATALGSPTTMPAKMISEMPLPTPRSLICSPSHMMKAQPVVRVSTVIRRKAQPGSGTSAAPAGVVVFSRNSAMPVDWMIETRTVP